MPQSRSGSGAAEDFANAAVVGCSPHAAKGYRDYRVISLGDGMSAPYTRKKPLAPNCGASSVPSAADFATGR